MIITNLFVTATLVGKSSLFLVIEPPTSADTVGPPPSWMGLITIRTVLDTGYKAGRDGHKTEISKAFG